MNESQEFPYRDTPQSASQYTYGFLIQALDNYRRNDNQLVFPIYWPETIGTRCILTCIMLIPIVSLVFSLLPIIAGSNFQDASISNGIL
jgi:hypothetical protein